MLVVQAEFIASARVNSSGSSGFTSCRGVTLADAIFGVPALYSLFTALVDLGAGLERRGAGDLVPGLDLDVALRLTACAPLQSANALPVRGTNLFRSASRLERRCLPRRCAIASAAQVAVQAAMSKAVAA